MSTEFDAILTALALNGAILLAEISAFTFVRRYFRLIYEPRSLSGFKASYRNRQQPLSPRLFGWPISIFKADYRKIKDINGLDSYFFIRFLRMMLRTMLPIWLLSWAILLPLLSANMTVVGIDNLVFGYIAPNQPGRYAGQLLLTWIFTIWIWWNIKYEMKHYVHVRQRYLVSPAHSSTAQARTVLVTGIPSEYLSEFALTHLFSHLPGGVRKVWINRDLGDMPKLYNRRLKVCRMLESVETSLLKKAIRRHSKKKKKIAKSGIKDNNSIPERDPEAVAEALIEELVPRKEWPSHRLPPFTWLSFSIPLMGKKVDTIEWACDQVHELNTQLGQKRAILARDIELTTAQPRTIDRQRHVHIGAGKLNIAIPTVPVTIPLVKPRVNFTDQTYPPTNGAFILFNKQIAAHMAVQALTHHEPYRMSMSQKYLEVAPEDVIWDKLVMNPYDRRVRLALSWAATIVLSIVWIFPVGFIGHFLRLDFRRQCTPQWLAFFCNSVQGFLPSVLLNQLFMTVPIFLRILIRLEGVPQKTGVELILMDRFFLFQVINWFLFLILSPLFELFRDPTSVPTMLAENLHQFSTFFLIFILPQGLSGTAGSFIRLGSLVVYYVKITLLGRTPRSVYAIKYSSRTSEWGALFPLVTQLVVITLIYSIISPIINGLAFLAFFLLYVLYKYIFTWVTDQPHSSDTGGLFFPKAIQHIFVGLYVQQLCLCALFFLAQNDSHKPSAIPEGVLMIVLMVFTAFFQNTIRNSYGPLIKFLPFSLVDKPYNRGVGVESEDPMTVDAPPPVPLLPEDIVVTDYANASNSHRHSGEGGSQRPDDADIELALLPSSTNESCQSSPSPCAKPIEKEGSTDFNHPATVEEQRIIWLPKDRLGLVHDLERDLDSQDIQHSTEGAEMDDKGRVDVTLAAPEDIRKTTRTRAFGLSGFAFLFGA